MKSFVTLRAHIPDCWISSAWSLSVPGCLQAAFFGQSTTLSTIWFSISLPSSM